MKAVDLWEVMPLLLFLLDPFLLLKPKINEWHTTPLNTPQKTLFT